MTAVNLPVEFGSVEVAPFILTNGLFTTFVEYSPRITSGGGNSVMRIILLPFDFRLSFSI